MCHKNQTVLTKAVFKGVLPMCQMKKYFNQTAGQVAHKSYLSCVIRANKAINPKRAGLFGPISQPGGGGFRPPKISETD